jgi:cation diffusion facilitator CzcD-associated flavoprotein CzcO
MLQRSPTYVAALPGEDRIARRLGSVLPRSVAWAVARWKNIGYSMWTYGLARRRPRVVRDYLVREARRALGPDVDASRHFAPRYDPWDQRLCLAPDGDLFAALRSGRASIVTDTIERFTETGIRLASGAELPADIIVTATGLELLAFGGVELFVDGERVDPAGTMAYKGMMLSDVPNMAFTVGYTNASWTLKSDLVDEYVCRLLAHMKKRGLRVATPRRRDPSVEPQEIINFSSGYVRRAIHRFPKQGSRMPWRLYNHYLKDLLLMRYAPVEDKAMEFLH